LSESKQRLILAAELLFAKSGIDGASLREIAARAGQANNSAVQYHFGSREGLVQAVFDHRMFQMEDRRGVMLAAARERGAINDLRSLFEILFLPQLDLHDLDGNHSYAHFLCQFLLRSRSTEFGEFGGPMPPNLKDVLDQIAGHVSHIAPAAAQRRLVTVCFMFLNILVIHGQDGASAEHFDDALNDTLDQMVAAFVAGMD
jgi:AcrR family transcriptional regulator